MTTQSKSTTVLALEYAEMYAEKRDLQVNVKAVTAKITRAEGVVLVHYADEAIQSIKTESGTV